MNLEVLRGKMGEIGAALPEGLRYEGPAAFLRGGTSDYVLDGDLPDILRHFPGAKLITLENTGHWLHAEQPEAFLAKSLDFMES
jgi:pimeloyl-ACP methyl ester carboxylesterase